MDNNPEAVGVMRRRLGQYGVVVKGMGESGLRAESEGAGRAQARALIRQI